MEFEFRALATPGIEARPPIPDRNSRSAAPAAESSTSYVPLEDGDEGSGVYKLHHIELATKSVEDELWEPILYLPRDPNVACLVDALDVVPAAESKWTEAAWQPRKRSLVLFVLARPLSVLVANLVFAHVFRDL